MRLLWWFSIWRWAFMPTRSRNSASIGGTVLDSSGAVVPNATVEIHNPVSHFDRSTTTDGAGRFSFANVPFNPYHLSVTGSGFAPYAQDVEVRSAVPLDIKVNLQVAGSCRERNRRGFGSRPTGKRSDFSHRRGSWLIR